MMRRNFESSPTGRVYQTAGLLLVLMIVLSVLVHSVRHGKTDTAGTDRSGVDKSARLLVAP